MYGLIVRNIGLLRATAAQFHTKNKHAILTLIRSQLESMLHFYAFFIVDDLRTLVDHLMDGRSLRMFKNSDGHHLKDSYLIAHIRKQWPEADAIHESLFHRIHFTEAHFFSDRVIYGDSMLTPSAVESLLEEAVRSIAIIQDITAKVLAVYEKMAQYCTVGIEE